MPRPGSLRIKPKKATFVVTKKQERKQSDFVPPVENVPKEVQDYAKVVYCNLSDCVFNKSVEGLTHTETVVRRENIKGSDWTPLSPQMEKVWTAVCTRPEVVINLETIKGMVPNILDMPEGCKFCTRCDFRVEKCDTIEPELLEISPEHFVHCHEVKNIKEAYEAK